MQKIYKQPEKRPSKPSQSQSAPLTSDSNPKNDAPERIAKVLARAGVASRRDIEKYIEAGRIKLNGTILTTPAIKVGAQDKILLDNKPVMTKAPTQLWRYHKPTGLVTSHKDEKGRETVFSSLPKSLGRVISIGRLDLNSEGLLLLTNDGDLARKLEHPKTGFSRRYRARAYGHITQNALDSLKAGIKIDGIVTGPIEAILDSQNGDNCWISVTIREGKNREVRRAMEHLGLRVNRLIRVSYGPFMLGTLGAGEYEAVKYKELHSKLGHLADFAKADIEIGKAAGHKKSIAANKSGKSDNSKAIAEPKGRGKFAKVKSQNKPSKLARKTFNKNNKALDEKPKSPRATTKATVKDNPSHNRRGKSATASRPKPRS